MIVAIDGPAGSGKGTIASLIAEKLNLVYIDTGATYRAIAYAVLKNSIDIDNEEKIVELSNNVNITFDKDKNVFLDGENITNKIRTKEVSQVVSPISAIIKLRENMVNLQREMAKGKDVIMEGRDITTVVFPNADYKFYIDASCEERAERRYKQNIEKNIQMSKEEIIENIKKRDYTDMNKKVGALKRTNDQIYIDTTNMQIEEVVSKIINYIKGEK